MTAAPVVIVGGGFGGLYTALALAARKGHPPILLIEPNERFLFLPLLYQMATAGLSAGDIAAPLRHILRAQRNVTVRLGEVTAIDCAARRVTLRDDDTGETVPSARIYTNEADALAYAEKLCA